ncbi:SGNH hydrolase-type esterase domain-containing protein [Mycena sp. CBHHK59/15]|nr:SGNH hydrolase-type esterase domain-containing protein [Mycena sp. CBHHK59/15]
MDAGMLPWYLVVRALLYAASIRKIFESRAGSGFKLHVKNLKISAGTNTIPVPTDMDGATTVVRVNVEGWQDNRMNLESIVLNEGASLLPYTPARLAFQFIGDSLSAGQFLPMGVDQAWPFLVGEAFKAEHVVCAQPGAALTDIVSYGNEHGVSFQFFRTEDTGYFYTTDHNYTTPWDFARDVPAPTHVVIHIGANDASQNVTAAQFVDVNTNFIARLRTIYRHQPIFVFTPWGWPNPDGTFGEYYVGQYQTIVDLQHAQGDESVFLVNTTGWVSYADVFPENQHPNVVGHEHIAAKFQAWLENWGLKPETQWATLV